MHQALLASQWTQHNPSTAEHKEVAPGGRADGSGQRQSDKRRPVMADVSPSLSRAVATRPLRRRRPTTSTLQPPAETATDRKSKVTGAEARATSRKATTAWLVAYQEAAYAWDDAVDDLEAHVEKEKEQQPSPEEARRPSVSAFGFDRLRAKYLTHAVVEHEWHFQIHF